MDKEKAKTLSEILARYKELQRERQCKPDRISYR